MPTSDVLYLCNYLDKGIEHAEIVGFESRGIWVVPVNFPLETDLDEVLDIEVLDIEVLVEWENQGSEYYVYGMREGQEVAGSIVADSSPANTVMLHLTRYKEETPSGFSDPIALS